MERIKIFNGNVITPGRIIANSTVVIANGMIESVIEGNVEIPGALEIDADGNYVSPGFIDLHVHGGGGHDFMDGTIEAFCAVAELHARYGTTSLLPTTLTSDRASIFETLDVYEAAKARNVKGAQFLGIHLEGPYFALSQKGAQDPRHIRNPDPDEYRTIAERYPFVVRWSAAPELPGSMEFGQFVASRGIIPSIGHTDAAYEHVVNAVAHGYNLVTHLYSCMSGVTRVKGRRVAGVIESSLLMDELTVEIIGDGTHLPAPLLKLIYKVKGPDKIIVVTDAMRAAGMPPGESILGSLKDGLRVIVDHDVARLPDEEAFAGSIATADRLLRTLIREAEIPLADAVKMMTATPAAVLNLQNRKGSLVKGKDADIVIFDKDITIKQVLLSGRTIL